MKIRQVLLKFGFDKGLFPDQAQAIFDQLQADGHFNVMDGRWDDDIEGYPSATRAALLDAYKYEASRWLEQNMPMHWARTAFDNIPLPDFRELALKAMADAPSTEITDAIEAEERG